MRHLTGSNGDRSRARRLAAAVLVVVLLLLSSACAVPAGTNRAAPTSAAALPGTTAPEPAGASGVLRLWWPTPRSLNPLAAATAAERAVYDLVYEGLCRIEADDSVSWQLAENLLFLEGGRQVLVALRQDITFHDGTPLTAGDVAGVMTAILDPASTSTWREGLENVVSVRALNDQVLEILLADPDPWLAWALVFPVIPASFLDADPFTPVPGTGPYAVRLYDPDKGLTLVRQAVSQAEPGLDEILVKAYSDQREAMKALEQDELDLVLLDGQALPLYSERSSLRLDRFASRELLLFLCNDQAKRPLNDTALRSQIKQVLESWRTASELPEWIATGETGQLAGSWLTRTDEPVAAAAILSGQNAQAVWSEKPLQLIVPSQDARRHELAKAAAGELEAAGQVCTVVPLEPEPFWQALLEGRYDLALLSATLPDKPDPGLLIRESPPLNFSGLDSLAASRGGLDGFETWRDRFLSLQATPKRDYSRAEQLSADWQAAWNEALARSNWSIVGYPCQGLAYGSRVLGQLRPNRYHPYDGMKELWIWSSPSSSSY